jgi:hypothetical protein
VQANVIEDENLQPGTTAWQLTNPADNRQIEGYASLTSVPVGGDIDLFVNTKDASYTLTVFRMGWYGGKSGRQVLGPQTLAGVQQPIPTIDPAVGFVECNWTNPFHLHVPTSWVSGIYLVKLHGNTSGKESYIIFTVRDSRAADLVFQQTIMTYQAYNGWPGVAFLGGTDAYSLYNVTTSLDSQGHNLPVPRVSFNRPYGGPPLGDSFYTNHMIYSGPFDGYGIGAGDFLYHGAPAAMEFNMVRWLEHHAYDVTYITDVDTHEDVGRLLRGKGYLSVGHDEYWSGQMRANVIQARDAGVSLGFFGGNYIYWAVDLSADSNGAPNRTISLVDPTKTCTYTCMGNPEQAIAGGNWVQSVPTNGDIFVSADAPLNHWVFANTGLNVGDIIPGLIGVEYNGTDPHVATPAGLQILLHSQAPRFESGLIRANGGFPLPGNFNGDFNAWADQAEAAAAANNGRYDSDQTFCQVQGVDTSTPCSMKGDCLPTDCGGPTNPTCNPDDYQCLYSCHQDPIPPLNIVPPDGFCSNPWPATIPFGARIDWSMTIYQVSSQAWVFNAGTNQWTWGLDDYFTGLQTPDGANNGPAFRTQCGYSWFHPDLVSCRSPAIEQITRNVLTKFQGQDTTPPQSTLTIGTPQYAASQLFVAAATQFTLTATDAASGVWNVRYRFFPSGGSPSSYTSVDGFSATFNVSGADGLYEVDTYATDNAGNNETPAHVQLVYLDNTAPVATISAPVTKQYLHGDTFTINYSVSDGTGSGVKAAVPDVDGQTTLHDGATPVTVANGLTVKLLTELTLGPHTFNLNSVDNVDNADTSTVNFSIIVTAQSIKDEVKYFRSIGAITQDEATSLLQKLNAAASYRARHDCKNANITYKNFINELRAQTGKKVTAQAASILIADAQYLIAHCP